MDSLRHHQSHRTTHECNGTCCSDKETDFSTSADLKTVDCSQTVATSEKYSSHDKTATKPTETTLTLRM
ncbi:hypothetical protein COCSUDRAFT_33342 [Coccomyxa subellipsoidea C-169]|uniref:Uncharacterized protein n=1 Tax=Coccomyxa subellipsoidea (strain C-169) TaxID=574566 RepID=I0YW43_COCSC|nr:hypothetical protein COCSUDRAFT_33342 [Coccomyxa subellipsoidea C-169]EIE22612.1 hypothetical protein COCSUDRAFT_33342 [Coccomyxa subellipsoidea C-169]|eukprot:XP_005647156.1 hypothetical protein COCSUDRAFT_33342 [Coccomyxa subellipsoidea C-169]